jgi:putative aldouronate transport system substrate-binding protein
MKKTVWKSVVFLAGMLMLAAVLGGCGKQSADGGAGPVEISILFSESGSAPYNSEWAVLKEIEKRQNVKLKLEVVPDSDYQTKRGIVMNSGLMPDLLSNTWAGEVSPYAVDGIMLAVSDYLDKMPNLSGKITGWDLEDEIENIREMDGKFYVLPGFSKEMSGNLGFGVRKDVFDKYRIALPDTYEELFEALAKIKRLSPDTLGFGDPFKGNLMMSFIASSFDTKGGWSLPNGYAYDYNKREWYFAPTSQQYKELLMYLNKLYQAGGLDSEAFIQDGNQFKQKILTEKYMVMPGSISEVRAMNNELSRLGVEGAKFEMLPPLAGPHGVRGTKPTSRYNGGMAMPATVAKKADFDKILAFCDWLYYGEEAAVLTKVGIEGLTYTVEDGQISIKPEIKVAKNPGGTIDWWKDYGVGMMSIVSLAPDLPRYIEEQITNPVDFAYTAMLRENNYIPKDDPLVKMSTEQRDNSKLYYTTLKNYYDQMFMKFIYGQESFDNWDAYVKNCEAKGSLELIRIVSEAWDAGRTE